MEFQVNNLNSESEIKLVGNQKQQAARGISQLFSFSSIRKTRSENIKQVSVIPWIRSKINYVKSLFTSSSNPSLPSSISNETAIYEYKPSFYCFSSMSAIEDWKKNQAPEQLICVGKREKQQTTPNSKQGTVFANLNLELKGRLGRTKEGAILLSLTPSLYQSLKQIFHLEDLDPVDFPHDVGPNISIIGSEEDPKGYITEIGEEYEFSIRRAFELEPNQWNHVESVYGLEIVCPKLQELRAKCRLNELPKGQPFHLLLGLKKTAKPICNRPDAFYKINVSYHPV